MLLTIAAASLGPAAAERAARTAPACKALGDFYWEVGDARGRLAGGAIGSSYGADSVMPIASATKLLFGAYVIERFRDDLAVVDAQAMTMRSGYVSLRYFRCVFASTVRACLDAGRNGRHTAAAGGLFDYNGGHYQRYAVALGLGGMTRAQLAAELKRVLGPELAIDFASPLLAGGARMSAAGYARFLRKVLASGLALRDHLGEGAVCTLPSACPKARSSPSPLAWHYSFGHWVEDDPAGDGAFSSPGAFGFYPWIDAARRHYGIVARRSLRSGAHLQSALCGRLIRRAFFAAGAAER